MLRNSSPRLLTQRNRPFAVGVEAGEQLLLQPRLHRRGRRRLVLLIGAETVDGALDGLAEVALAVVLQYGEQPAGGDPDAAGADQGMTSGRTAAAISPATMMFGAARRSRGPSR
jgi:hypothetical protein